MDVNGSMLEPSRASSAHVLLLATGVATASVEKLRMQHLWLPAGAAVAWCGFQQCFSTVLSVLLWRFCGSLVLGVFFLVRWSALGSLGMPASLAAIETPGDSIRLLFCLPSALISLQKWLSM